MFRPSEFISPLSELAIRSQEARRLSLSLAQKGVDHFAAYLNHVQAKGSTVAHIADLKRKAERLFADGDVGMLRDIAAEV